MAASFDVLTPRRPDDDAVRRAVQRAAELSLALLGRVDETADRLGGARQALAARLVRPRHPLHDL